MCKCGLGHRGWEDNLCRIEIFKRAEASKTVVTTAPAAKIKTIPSGPRGSKKAVTVTKQAKASVTVTTKPVTVTSRMAELRKRKAADGLVQVMVWTKPENVAKIKDFANALSS